MICCFTDHPHKEALQPLLIRIAKDLTCEVISVEMGARQTRIR